MAMPVLKIEHRYYCIETTKAEYKLNLLYIY